MGLWLLGETLGGDVEPRDANCNPTTGSTNEEVSSFCGIGIGFRHGIPLPPARLVKRFHSSVGLASDSTVESPCHRLDRWDWHRIPPRNPPAIGLTDEEVSSFGGIGVGCRHGIPLAPSWLCRSWAPLASSSDEDVCGQQETLLGSEMGRGFFLMVLLPPSLGEIPNPTTPTATQ